MTFKAGDKVKVFSDKTGEIVCGPVRSTFATYMGYVVKVDGEDVWHKAHDLSAVPELPKFAVGDKVQSRSGITYTVEAGPFFAPGEWYALKADTSGNVVHSHADEVSIVQPEAAPIQVGDRVRVVAASYASETHGKVGTVLEVDLWEDFDDIRHPFYVSLGNGNNVYASAVEGVTDEDTYEHNGVTYDLSAKYQDMDGDVWRLARVNGVARARMDGDRQAPTEQSFTLEHTIERWGPLTRVSN